MIIVSEKKVGQVQCRFTLNLKLGERDCNRTNLEQCVGVFHLILVKSVDINYLHFAMSIGCFNLPLLCTLKRLNTCCEIGVATSFDLSNFALNFFINSKIHIIIAIGYYWVIDLIIFLQGDCFSLGTYKKWTVAIGCRCIANCEHGVFLTL